MGSTFDRLVDRPVRTDKVRLAYLPDDAERLNDARRDLDTAKLAAEQDPEDAVAAGKLGEARAVFDELESSMLTVTFRMAGIGPKRVEQMMVDMPATAQQEKKARAANQGKPQHLQWNEDSFPAALLAACVTRVEFSDDMDNPLEGLSEAQANELWESKWSIGDRSLLFLTALSLDQSTSRVEDLGKD